ncbi:MAG TPA: NAD-binding protein [Streptosporangiaceae bacterium]|nr:NAD-binding protein [Streptosporangiaceae bacterium]
MTAQSAEPADHVIICGANALASRMAEELTARYGLAVTAIVPSGESEPAARMRAMPNVRLLERARLDDDAFLEAGLPDALGLAILNEDDLGNVRAAMRAQKVRPGIRLVIAIFNAGLGARIRSFFPNCAVLSQAQTAAPSLVAAALGEPAPSQLRLAGQTMYVTRRERVRAGQIICGLAASADAEAPSLLPPEDAAAGLVLAVADGTPRNPLSRRRQRRLAIPLRLLRRVFGTQLGLVFAGLLVVLVAGFALLAANPVVPNASLGFAFYQTLLDAAGDAVPASSPGHLPAGNELAQVLLTFDGLAFLPVVTAAFVGARISGTAERDQPPLAGHVIVAGLGTVGTRVVGMLHDLGVDVVAIDQSNDAAGLPLARRLGVRIVIGEAQEEETLRAAGITTCQAIVSVTNNDIANLEAALHTRELAADPRIVIRLYDDDMAAYVQARISKTVSRSTSYLAAPEFAAAVLDHQVLRTIAVGRHVLLLAEIAVADDGGADVAGERIADVHQPGLLRVIGLRRSGSQWVDWSPAGDYVLTAGDRLLVLATRAGLSVMLRPDGSVPAAQPPWGAAAQEA